MADTRPPVQPQEEATPPSTDRYLLIRTRPKMRHCGCTGQCPHDNLDLRMEVYGIYRSRESVERDFAAIPARDATWQIIPLERVPLLDLRKDRIRSDDPPAWQQGCSTVLVGAQIDYVGNDPHLKSIHAVGPVRSDRVEALTDHMHTLSDLEWSEEVPDSPRMLRERHWPKMITCPRCNHRFHDK